MAVTLKQIARGSIAAGVNTLTTTDVESGKVQVIKSIRLVNKHATASEVFTTFSAGPTGTEAFVAPQNLSLGPGQAYVDDVEIVLKTSDHLKVVTGSAGGPVDYVISGFEREQS